MKRQIALIATLLARKALKQIPILVLLVLADGYVETSAQALATLWQFESIPTDGAHPHDLHEPI